MDLLSASVKTQRAGSETYVIVAISGEADATSCDKLREALDGEIRKQPRAMIIDLSGLRFMDSTALHVILRANRELGRHGCVLALAAPREPVAKVLRLTATDQLIPVYPSVGEAIAGLTAREPDMVGAVVPTTQARSAPVMACVLAWPTCT